MLELVHLVRDFASDLTSMAYPCWAVDFAVVLAAEILELAGNAARDNKKQCNNE